jgi:hypothetical protein
VDQAVGAFNKGSRDDLSKDEVARLLSCWIGLHAMSGPTGGYQVCRGDTGWLVRRPMRCAPRPFPFTGWVRPLLLWQQRPKFGDGETASAVMELQETDVS